MWFVKCLRVILIGWALYLYLYYYYYYFLDFASHLARSDTPRITCVVVRLSRSDTPTLLSRPSDQWQGAARAALESRACT